MPSEAQRTSPRTTAVCVLAGILLVVLPESVTALIRDAVRGAMAPSQLTAVNLVHRIGESWRSMISEELAAEHRTTEELRERLKAEELRRRRLEIANAGLQRAIDQVKAQGASPFPVSESQPLLALESIEARVIAREIVTGWKARPVLDAGSLDQILEDQWVLEKSTVALDHGTSSRIEPGLPAFAGRCLVGRIVEAGRWTSSLQLITDPDFRSKAVVAVGGATAQFSQPFLLEGTGNGECRLVQVPASLRVFEGDAVYTVPGDKAIDVPMLLGHVVSIVQTDGALSQDIVVHPATDPASVRAVQIVTTKLNPLRILSQR